VYVPADPNIITGFCEVDDPEAYVTFVDGLTVQVQPVGDSVDKSVNVIDSPKLIDVLDAEKSATGGVLGIGAVVKPNVAQPVACPEAL
jgi:hypothetical protein